MLNLGTGLQSPYGWCLDSTTGDPELYLFVGKVTDADTDVNSHNTSLSNKLWKLTLDHENKTISATLVKQLDTNNNIASISATGTYTVSQAPNSIGCENCTFISRDVFVVTEAEAKLLTTTDQPYRTVLFANKFNGPTASDPVDEKIWARVIIYNSKEDPGNTSNLRWTTYKNSYPGPITGLCFVPPNSNYFDSYPNSSNILVLNGIFPYGGPISQAFGGGDNNQNHKVGLRRLSTVDANINNNYYENSTSWVSGADGTALSGCAFFTVRDMGAGGATNSTNSAANGGGIGIYDHSEGWCTMTSDGTVFYGNATYRGSVQDTTAGGFHNGVAYESIAEFPWAKSIYSININSTTSLRKVYRIRNADNSADIYNGVLPGTDLRIDDYFECASGECDIYGQVNGGAYGKDALFLLVTRNSYQGVYNQLEAARVGIHVFKKHSTKNTLMRQEHYTFSSNTLTALFGAVSTTNIVNGAGLSFRPNWKIHK